MVSKFKIATIVGARPQFVKASIFGTRLREYIRDQNKAIMEEVLIHTGQHYDFGMSQMFFDQLKIPAPSYNLNVGSGRHGEQTANMLKGVENVLLKERPCLVVVFGDTNSTLAGALAAAKLNMIVAHVEAGLRSYNRLMPEEINRIITDRLSELLFCPTKTSVLNLQKEGISEGVHQVGDIMLDVFLEHRDLALRESRVLDAYRLKPGSYCLATIHRQENTECPDRLRNIFSAFAELANAECPFIVPLHPRTRNVLMSNRRSAPKNAHVILTPPLAYLDMLALEIRARAILTDSGGVQREAYFANVPCLTLRNETEWPETTIDNRNILAGTEAEGIIRAFGKLAPTLPPALTPFFGDGKASEKIVEIISQLVRQSG